MRLQGEDLKHRLPANPSVFFPLSGELKRKAFERIMGVLDRQAGRRDTTATAAEHWSALEERNTGSKRWDRLVARYSGPTESKEDGIRQRASFHNVGNVLAQRPYTAHTVEGIQYVVDLFNPANELEMPYAGAGETVVALLLRELEFGTVQYRLVQNAPFYRIVREIAEILEPECVRGTYSMFPILVAYLEGRLNPKRPWELLFPLSVLTKPAALAPSADLSTCRTTNDSLALLWPMLASPRFRGLPLARLFKKVEVWDENRILVQVWNGLESVLRDEYGEAARTLGMSAVQELVA